MPALVYQNFDLLLERSPTGYRARVLDSPAGQENGDFSLPLELTQSADALRLVGGTIRAFQLTKVNGVAPTQPRDPKPFGADLFNRLFSGEVGQLYRRSLDAVRQQQQGLRVRLRLNDVPELAALPWEYLYDSSANRYLVLSESTPLVRYLALPLAATPLQIERPLRILGLTANAPDVLPQLDVAGERQRLDAALAELVTAGAIEITWLTNATLGQLQRALRRNHYHIIHFIGHGWADLETQESGLVLVNEAGRGDKVEVDRLAILLQNHATLRLAFLNACEGARQVEGEPFGGVAQHLIRQGLPAVIAMQFPVSDRAAIALAQEFYSALADDYGVDGALAEARKMVYTQSSIMEWGTPVLFMRADDGRLWVDETTKRKEKEALMAKPANINTDGGAYIGGSVSVGGEFVGRDKIVHGDEVKGDKIAGDKIMGDQVSGHKAGGDVIVATVGAGASNVAVGKNIQQIINNLGTPTPADRQAIETHFERLFAVLNTAAIDPRKVGRAEGDLETLKAELTKIGEQETPNAATITRIGDWLLDNVPELAQAVTELFGLPAVAKVLGKAGEAAVAWWKRRFTSST